MRLRIATRRSRLALWQAQHVAERLRAGHRDLEIAFVPLATSGDRHSRGPLAEVGGKGLFVKELEQALAAGEADIAVHSMKDVPSVLAPGFVIAAVLERADARDALLARDALTLDRLPEGARVGTSSLRRQCQLKALRPTLVIEPLRGNVDTRLRRLEEGALEAIVLACAGLIRLGLAGRITEYLEPERSLPAPGQGVIGIECREDDAPSRDLAATVDDPSTHRALEAERTFAAGLGASCHSPVAAHARIAAGRLRLDGLVGLPDGSLLVRGHRQGELATASEVGRALAEELLGRGAAEILARVEQARGAPSP